MLASRYQEGPLGTVTLLTRHTAPMNTLGCASTPYTARSMWRTDKLSWGPVGNNRRSCTAFMATLSPARYSWGHVWFDVCSRFGVKRNKFHVWYKYELITPSPPSCTAQRMRLFTCTSEGLCQSFPRLCSKEAYPYQQGVQPFSSTSLEVHSSPPHRLPNELGA